MCEDVSFMVKRVRSRLGSPSRFNPEISGDFIGSINDGKYGLFTKEIDGKKWVEGPKFSFCFDALMRVSRSVGIDGSLGLKDSAGQVKIISIGDICAEDRVLVYPGTTLVLVKGKVCREKEKHYRDVSFWMVKSTPKSEANKKGDTDILAALHEGIAMLERRFAQRPKFLVMSPQHFQEFCEKFWEVNTHTAPCPTGAPFFMPEITGIPVVVIEDWPYPRFIMQPDMELNRIYSPEVEPLTWPIPPQKPKEEPVETEAEKLALDAVEMLVDRKLVEIKKKISPMMRKLNTDKKLKINIYGTSLNFLAARIDVDDPSSFIGGMCTTVQVALAMDMPDVINLLVGVVKNRVEELEKEVAEERNDGK